ncbi:DUF3291 domain-containing protein [Occallatibacter savannae]|uniref:DUF3291 domain-containing protein n=1 Tax=Occallatibacter savannae TaxID=1002691 RepID=UPI000D6935AD|nr:DUF3291 domain-containing protein [Occallatibacter savannae]
MPRYNVAQVNIGRIRAELNDPIMAGFVNRLDEINALADSSSGFVWRLIESEGNATYLRPFDDPWMLLNMSVWESIEDLRRFVYETSHRELLKQRHDWFERLAEVYSALWWVPDGHIPSVDEAKQRLAHLRKNGPTQFAFTFKTVVEPDEEFQKGIDWGAFRPCPAV